MNAGREAHHAYGEKNETNDGTRAREPEPSGTEQRIRPPPLAGEGEGSGTLPAPSGIYAGGISGPPIPCNSRGRLGSIRLLLLLTRMWFSPPRSSASRRNRSAQAGKPSRGAHCRLLPSSRSAILSCSCARSRTDRFWWVTRTNRGRSGWAVSSSRRHGREEFSLSNPGSGSRTPIVGSIFSGPYLRYGSTGGFSGDPRGRLRHPTPRARDAPFYSARCR